MLPDGGSQLVHGPRQELLDISVPRALRDTTSDPDLQRVIPIPHDVVPAEMVQVFNKQTDPLTRGRMIDAWLIHAAGGHLGQERIKIGGSKVVDSHTIAEALCQPSTKATRHVIVGIAWIDFVCGGEIAHRLCEPPGKTCSFLRFLPDSVDNSVLTIGCMAKLVHDERMQKSASLLASRYEDDHHNGLIWRYSRSPFCD